MASLCCSCCTVLALTIFSFSVLSCSAANFYQDVDVTWGGDSRAKFLDGGRVVSLALDKSSGSGFKSKNPYLFGRFDIQIKLVQGESAGTVTAYYLSSEGANHDEIDFEFLGNVSGQPYTVHTNLYSQGKGDREQQFSLWFDPTKDFHTYSLIWNPKQTMFMVDGTPIRVFKNSEAIGVPYPKTQPMTLYVSLWDADDWATMGGRVKTDWSKAPFVASFQDFAADGCLLTSSAATGSAVSSCTVGGAPSWMYQELDSGGVEKLEWVQKNYMIYNYCTDVRRFPQGLPPECTAAAGKAP